MENSYSLYDYIEMLEDIITKAMRVPFGKKSFVDVGELDDIVSGMRMAMPSEIQQAQRVVADKNRIISDAKKEAEDIVRRAEQRRKELLEQSDIMKEARRVATEMVAQAQARSTEIHAGTNAFADSTLSKVEAVMAKELNDLRLVRKNIQAAAAGKAQPKAPAKPADPNQQTN